MIASTTPGWGLTPALAATTQGFVVSPFAHEPVARALFLALPARAGGGWLAALRAMIPITDADGKDEDCAAIAFTATGLDRMGLSDVTMASFSQPFLQGMGQADRARRLGDIGDAVIAGGSAWSGNGALAQSTPVGVHVLLLLYARDVTRLDARCAAAKASLAAANVSVVRERDLSLRVDAAGIAREHFGFADGISQPLPHGVEILAGGKLAPADPLHGVASGDILMGSLNAHGEPAPGPIAPDSPGAAMLPVNDAPFGFRDLGAGGSYLVVRELRQDVAGFWTTMDREAAALADPAISPETLAAKVVGRDQHGQPLSAAARVGGAPGQPANGFRYFADDPNGFSCPVGAHVRRANPRDGLAPSATDAPGLLQSANFHRILRRGRKFGPDIADPRVDDGRERGLLFMCLNTDLVRQFEFVQQTWMFNPNFHTLKGESDPLVGLASPFTMGALPLRRRANVDTFVKFAGGEYFFLPSLPALDYLQTLG